MHLERLISILEIVGRKREATVGDICAESGLPKPSVYRLVQSLTSTGLLEPLEKGLFVVGTRLKLITHVEQSDAALSELITPTLSKAADTHGTTFFLSRLRQDSVEIIHVVTPDSGVSYLHPGLGKRPLHACSCSKAVVAFSPELLQNKKLKGRLKAYTENTITKISELETELESIRQRGFAECVEEIERGMCSVAAPISTIGFGKTLSVGATGSMRVFDKKFRANIGRVLVGITNTLSQDFGWQQSASNS